MMKLLNVGGASKSIPVPPWYKNHEHHLLDIVSGEGVDLVADARRLHEMPELANMYDDVYCSHNLEHYTEAEADLVLKGFLHILKPGGVAFIRVPNIEGAMKKMFEKGVHLEDTAYVSPGGLIRYKDIIYGHGPQVEEGLKQGNTFMMHKNAFSIQGLRDILTKAGFMKVNVMPTPDGMELGAGGMKPHTETTRFLRRSSAGQNAPSTAPAGDGYPHGFPILAPGSSNTEPPATDKE
jgi:SAM-dependent methyltransferase